MYHEKIPTVRPQHYKKDIHTLTVKKNISKNFYANTIKQTSVFKYIFHTCALDLQASISCPAKKT